MDVLCSDKTGTLTLNKLSVDKNLVEVGLYMKTSISVRSLIWVCYKMFLLQVFVKGLDADTVILMAARASRMENQDAIDAAVVGTLADTKEVHSINTKMIFFDQLIKQFVHFLSA